MEKRINIEQLEPAAYKAMYGLHGYLATSSISKTISYLIMIRASQINGCAFCIDMHTKEALKNGETNQRIFLISAWREANVFTKDEKIILALTEEITLIHNQGLTDKTYQEALAAFGPNKVAQLIMMVVTINAWNRIAVSTQLEIPK